MFRHAQTTPQCRSLITSVYHVYIVILLTTWLSTTLRIRSLSPLQPALAQWSYSGPAVGCTDVLDAYTSGVRSIPVSGTSRITTVNNVPRFELRGPGCTIRGAFSIVFDVSAMRALAVAAGQPNVSIAILDGVRFEGLRDTGAAVSTWPLRLPTMTLQLAPSDISPADPNALPVDLSIRNNISWALSDITFSTTLGVSTLTWPLISLLYGNYLPRGSRITITNSISGTVQGLAINTGSFILFVMVVLYVPDNHPLILRENTVISLDHATILFQGSATTKVSPVLNLIASESNSPVTLEGASSQLIVNDCAVTMNTTQSNMISLGLLNLKGNTTLRDASRMALGGSTIHVFNSSGSFSLTVMLFQTGNPLVLRDQSQLSVSGCAVSMVKTSGSFGANLYLLFTHLAVDNTAQVSVRGSSVTMLDTSGGYVNVAGMAVGSLKWSMAADARVMIELIAVRAQSVVATTALKVLVIGGIGTESMDMDGRSSVSVSRSTAAVTNVTAPFTGGAGAQPIASIFNLATTLRSSSTVTLCKAVPSVTGSTIAATFYAGACTAPGAVGPALQSLTALNGCNISVSPKPCGLFISNSTLPCRGPQTKTRSNFPTNSAAHIATTTETASSALTATEISTRSSSVSAPTATMTARTSILSKTRHRASISPSVPGSATPASTSTATATTTTRPTATSTITISRPLSNTLTLVLIPAPHTASLRATSSNTEKGTHSMSNDTLTATTVATPTVVGGVTPRREATSSGAFSGTSSHSASLSNIPSARNTIPGAQHRTLTNTPSARPAAEIPPPTPLPTTVPVDAEAAVVALSGVLASTVAADLQAQSALTVSRCAAERQGGPSAASDQSFRALSPLATSDSCDGLLQGHAILLGVAVLAMGAAAAGLAAWHRIRREPPQPLHIVLSAVHCPSLLLAVCVFMLTGLVVCGGRVHGATQGLALTLAMLLSAAGPVLAALLGTRRYVRFAAAPVPAAYRASAAVCGAANVLLPRGELHEIQLLGSEGRAAIQWPRLLAAAVGAWRLPSPLLALVPQMSTLALAPAVLASGALCSPLHWVSAGLFWASAAVIAVVRPRRILIADVLHSAALAVNGALVATVAARASNQSSRSISSLLTLAQTALTVLRVVHIVFLLLLPRLAPMWRDAMEEAVKTDPDGEGGGNDPARSSGGWVFVGWCHRQLRILRVEATNIVTVPLLSVPIASGTLAKSTEGSLSVLSVSMASLHLPPSDSSNDLFLDSDSEKEDCAAPQRPLPLQRQQLLTDGGIPSPTTVNAASRPPTPPDGSDRASEEGHAPTRASFKADDDSSDHLSFTHNLGSFGLELDSNGSRSRSVSLYSSRDLTQRPSDVVATLGINDPGLHRAAIALERADRETRRQLQESLLL